VFQGLDEICKNALAGWRPALAILDGCQRRCKREGKLEFRLKFVNTIIYFLYY